MNGRCDNPSLTRTRGGRGTRRAPGSPPLRGVTPVGRTHGRTRTGFQRDKPTREQGVTPRQSRLRPDRAVHVAVVDGPRRLRALQLLVEVGTEVLCRGIRVALDATAAYARPVGSGLSEKSGTSASRSQTCRYAHRPRAEEHSSPHASPLRRSPARWPLDRLPARGCSLLCKRAGSGCPPTIGRLGALKNGLGNDGTMC